MSRFAALVFGVTGLAGPSLGFATWILVRLGVMSDRNGTFGFILDLLLNIHPAQLLAMGSYSQTRGAFLAIGGNVTLFVLVGLVVGAAAAMWKSAVWVAYAVHCVALGLLAFVLSGFSWAHLQLIPLVVAMALYAIPYWIVGRAATNRMAGRSS